MLFIIFILFFLLGGCWKKLSFLLVLIFMKILLLLTLRYHSFSFSSPPSFSPPPPFLPQWVNDELITCEVNGHKVEAKNVVLCTNSYTYEGTDGKNGLKLYPDTFCPLHVYQVWSHAYTFICAFKFIPSSPFSPPPFFPPPGRH